MRKEDEVLTAISPSSVFFLHESGPVVLSLLCTSLVPYSLVLCSSFKDTATGVVEMVNSIGRWSLGER